MRKSTKNDPKMTSKIDPKSSQNHENVLTWPLLAVFCPIWASNVPPGHLPGSILVDFGLPGFHFGQFWPLSASFLIEKMVQNTSPRTTHHTPHTKHNTTPHHTTNHKPKTTNHKPQTTHPTPHTTSNHLISSAGGIPEGITIYIYIYIYI